MKTVTTSSKAVVTSQQLEKSQEHTDSFYKEFRRPIVKILEDLSKPIPQRFIKYKLIKGNRIEFVRWTDLARLIASLEVRNRKSPTPNPSQEGKSEVFSDRSVCQDFLFLDVEIGFRDHRYKFYLSGLQLTSRLLTSDF